MIVNCHHLFFLINAGHWFISHTWLALWCLHLISYCIIFHKLRSCWCVYVGGRCVCMYVWVWVCVCRKLSRSFLLCPHIRLDRRCNAAGSDTVINMGSGRRRQNSISFLSRKPSHLLLSPWKERESEREKEKQRDYEFLTFVVPLLLPSSCHTPGFSWFEIRQRWQTGEGGVENIFTPFCYSIYLYWSFNFRYYYPYVFNNMNDELDIMLHWEAWDMIWPAVFYSCEPSAKPLWNILWFYEPHLSRKYPAV